MKQLNSLDSGQAISAFLHLAEHPEQGLPVLVVLHGGTFTSDYFRVACSTAGSFVTVANRNGFHVLAIDRPGYGQSAGLPDAEYAFPHQAALLDTAIAELLPQTPGGEALLVGHSIGGMIALEIAARQPSWALIGVCATGMGARIPAGGPAEQLGSLPFTGVVDLPVPQREQLWYGPPGSYSDAAVLEARGSFAPAPMAELVYAPTWAAQRLAAVASDVRVPVHHALAEFDALWDPSPEARETFLAHFGPGASVESEIVQGVGHCIDHHILGSALHLRQLAFARQCAWKATSPGV